MGEGEGEGGEGEREGGEGGEGKREGGRELRRGEESGFVAAEVGDLPLDRKALYNHRRNSKVVMKELRDEPLKPTAADNGKE